MTTLVRVLVYCLWPLPRVLLVCTTAVDVVFVVTPTCTISVHYCSMCTVCGHPTMRNYSLACTTINSSRSSSSSLPAITATSYYKIVGVAVLAFRLSLLLPTIEVKYTCTVCGHYHYYSCALLNNYSCTLLNDYSCTLNSLYRPLHYYYLAPLIIV